MFEKYQIQSQLKQNQILRMNMFRTFQTKINILDSHVNPLMKFLIQRLRKVLNKSKEKFQILHISHTYLINLTFQNLQNFGMLHRASSWL